MAFDVQVKTSPIFMLDEILEQIFLHLDSRSLLASRLVSRQWRSAATPQLRKKIQIHLYNFKLGAADSNKNSQHDKSLDDLSTILRQSEELNFLFPCNNFSFIQTESGDAWANLSDAGFQDFLYTHGPKYIKELRLSFRGRYTRRGYHCPHESVVMAQIQNLLLNQTPNLKTLTLNIDSELGWRNKTNHPCVWQVNAPLQKTDPEYREIQQQILSHPPSSRNMSLKKFKPVGELSAKVFETVILLCPNLQEIIFDDETFLPYIIDPVNRFHLLKTLDFDLSPLNFEIMEKISFALQQQEQRNLKLRRFTIFFRDFLVNQAKLRSEMDTAFEDRVVFIINQILASSADSLATFVWHRMTYLKGLQLPLYLPKVTRLELSGQPSVTRILPFPSDFFSLLTTFPNLNHISVHWSTEDEFQKFLYLFDPSGYIPVLSVKTVEIIFDKYSSRQDLSTETLQRVCDLFPNALVKQNRRQYSNKS